TISAAGRCACSRTSASTRRRRRTTRPSPGSSPRSATRTSTTPSGPCPAATGKNMQKSRVEEDKLPLARSILAKARDKGVELLLPVDVVAAPGLDAASGETVSADAVPPDTMALDVGP